jgi:hypothetical protein
MGGFWWGEAERAPVDGTIAGQVCQTSNVPLENWQRTAVWHPASVAQSVTDGHSPWAMHA